MATKNNPGKFDCYTNAAPDEPLFTLIGRDPTAATVVDFWLKIRRELGCTEPEKLAEAEVCVVALEQWAKGIGKSEKIVAAQAAAMRVMEYEARRRERLPDVRPGITHHFVIITKCHKLKCVAGKVDDTDALCSSCDGTGLEEVDGYITTGLYADGRVGEIYVKVGGANDKFVMLDMWAIAFSVALQHGAPLEELCGKFKAQRFWPDGPTDNDKIPRATSIVDYCARWLYLTYCKAATAATAEDVMEAMEAAKAAVQS